MKAKENPKRTARASGTSMTSASQKVLFFLVMVYDRLGDGDKHAYETLVLEDLVFMLQSFKN